jgi:hypothetical protein
MTAMTKLFLAMAEPQAFGNHWSTPKMFQPLGFLSHNLINVQAEMMHGAKGCARRYVSSTILSSTNHIFISNLDSHCVFMLMQYGLVLILITTVFLCLCSMVWIRASSPTTLPTQLGTSRMVHLHPKKGVAVP